MRFARTYVLALTATFVLSSVALAQVPDPVTTAIAPTRKTSGESDLRAALQRGIRIESAREPTTRSLLLSVPVMVPMRVVFVLFRVRLVE